MMKNTRIWMIVALVGVVSLMRAVGEVLDITGLGVASQTSEWNGGQFPASFAVDGNPGTFSHTNTTTVNNAWELFFAEEHEVARVEVSMRADCCPGRMTGVVVRGFDAEGDSVYSEPLVDPGLGGTVGIEFPIQSQVKRLRIGFENGGTNPGASTTMIHLGEVRVFAQDAPLPEIVSFTVDDFEIDSGEAVTLSWTTEAAVEVRLFPAGDSVPASGAMTVNPAESQVYSLEVSNERGRIVESLGVVVGGENFAPKVTEFLASNSGSLIRSDGSTPDWIEIWNPNPGPLDLQGYGLSDGGVSFTFPSMVLPGRSFLVVDAADLPVDGVLATGFSLSRDGGSALTFSDPGGTILESLIYPKQSADVSYGRGVDGSWGFFSEPSAGQFNGGKTWAGFVEDTQFSVKRGFYESAQSVVISTATPAATIYYTIDGSEPSPENAASIVYENPVSVSTTTVLRARAFRDGWAPTDADTQTYLFASQVGQQSSSPADFPQQWVPNLSGVQSPVKAYSHFGMNAGVLSTLPMVDQEGAAFELADALMSIPTMSLVMDADELFDPINGLHVNAGRRGRSWERAASLEIIDPNAGTTEQVNCGIRMHGGWNRFAEMLKKSFRIYLRSEYGDAKLKYPLFPGSEIEEFDRLILRSGNGKAWASPWRSLAGAGNSLERVTYLRDQMMRDFQRGMGHESLPGTFVHLYINGHYWGLYNPVERPTGHFAAARYGGDSDDYDVIKWSRGVGHQVAAGEDVAWKELINLVRGNVQLSATYEAIGERLDLVNFIDYILVNHFAGNIDWVDNNVYAMRNRVAGGPFRFYCWDSEESFLSLGTDISEGNVGDTCAEIHRALRANAEYRQLFADRAQKHFFQNGALTSSRTSEVFNVRVGAIDQAIVGESARWGDLLRPTNPYDRNDWLAEVGNLRKNYLGSRVSTTLAQLKADGLFPSVAAPLFFPKRGGVVEMGTAVTMSTNEGTIYYTLDGSDPRLVGGGVNPEATSNADAVEILGDTLIRARVLNGGVWSALDEALYLVGSRADDLAVSELMYHPGEGGEEFLEIVNRGEVSHRLSDLRITGGIQFDFSQATISELAPGERLVLARDGVRFAQIYPGTQIAGNYDGGLGNSGDSLSLETVDGDVLWTLTYSDLPPWPAETDGEGRSLVYRGGEASEPGSWRSSVELGGNPGTSDRVPLGEGQDLETYVIGGQAVLLEGGEVGFEVLINSGADDVSWTPEWSSNLDGWSGDGITLISQNPAGNGMVRQRWEMVLEGGAERVFFRVNFERR